ncbi:MAG: hypothetical protein AB8B52_02565 [Winogradskyella sp.]|uniref:hypothetical protein n=1 Tax=Winogradskyella sp. TaxID=1883156 RepID=UPI003859846D
MSEKLPEPSQNEEVDLGQLFNAIGNLFQRLFNFIGSIFKGIFSAIIYAIKPLVDYFKWVGPIVVIAAVLGYIYDNSKEPIYYSDMVVKPYFDSKYQLSNNVDYFNTLISAKNVTELASIFELDTVQAKNLVSFELEAGPETQNDLFVEYDLYIEAIDTSIVDELTYPEYVKNRDFFSGTIFTINAKAKKNDIFTKLQEGFRKTFENDLSRYKKHIRDTVAHIERLSLTNELLRLDTIQNTYLQVLKNQSQKGELSLALGNLPLQEEKAVTREFELFIRGQEIMKNLNELNQTVAEKNTYFEVLAPFDRLGSEDRSILQRSLIVFPILIIILFMSFFVVIKVFKFIKNYK